MQYNFWGCRRQKPWFWFLTVSQLVPTNIENVPGWFSMSHNVILVLRMQYYFWGCSITSEDAVQFLRRQKAKTLILMSRSVPTCPNKYRKCPRMIYNVSFTEDAVLLLSMQYNYWGCRRQKLWFWWFWSVTVSHLVPTNIKMSQDDLQCLIM